MANPTAQTPSPKRRLGIWLLVLLGALVLALAAVSAWIRVTALDNATWESNSGQLLESSAVRAAVAGYTVDQIFASRDVKAQLQSSLPERAKPLAAPLAGALQEVAYRATTEALARPRVQALWRTANGRAHAQLVDLLEGKSDRLTIVKGAVVLDLAPVIADVASRVGVGESAAAKLRGQIPPIVLVRSNQLSAVQKGVRVLNQLSVVLVAIGFAMWAAAVWLARGRRRETVRAMSMSLIVVGAALLFVRSLGGSYVVDSLVKTDSIRAAANDVWNIYTAGLRDVALLVLVFGLIGAVWTWLSGTSSRAVAVRARFGPVGRDHPGYVHAALVTVILLLVLWAPFGHTMRFFTFLVLVAILFTGLETLRRQSVREIAVPAQQPVAPPPQTMPRSRARETASSRDDTPSLR